jgi:hydrogenase nickel incorporation protein HypB
MCATCGCGTEAREGRRDGNVHVHEHAHRHEHEHGHTHGHGRPDDASVVHLEQKILARNDEQAARNRRWLSDHRVMALNLVSAPGAGKTTLLERTLRELGRELAFQVIEGDQETDNDARRIRATGSRAVQINTGAGCHLDAVMVDRGLREVAPLPGSVVMIENVGNLVCPALFDLGEQAKVLVASVTEGDDKPVKYPYMFRASDLVLLNKVDLLPHVPFSVERFQATARQVNPRVRVIETSALQGEGMEHWYQWVRERVRIGTA